MLAPVSIALITLLAEPQLSQDVYPPGFGVTMLSPPGRQTGEYDCGAGKVRVDLTSPGYFEGAPKIASWEVGGRKILPVDLNRWNAWLEELAIYDSFSVTCRGELVRIDIGGSRRGDGAEHSISITWSDGEMWRTPLGDDDWRRAREEGWFPPHEHGRLTKEN